MGQSPGTVSCTSSMASWNRSSCKGDSGISCAVAALQRGATIGKPDTQEVRALFWWQCELTTNLLDERALALLL